MAYRFVRARPISDRLPELRERLHSGEISEIEPFGHAVTTASGNARFDPDSRGAVWIEEDYTSRGSSKPSRRPASSPAVAYSRP